MSPQFEVSHPGATGHAASCRFSAWVGYVPVTRQHDTIGHVRTGCKSFAGGLFDIRCTVIYHECGSLACYACRAGCIARPNERMVNDAHSSDRRNFFRDALRQAVTPLVDYLDGQSEAPSSSHLKLRPPGAVEESRFLETCQHCAACVNVCPAVAISLLDQTHGAAAGTPVIDADLAACVVCEGLKCTHACPSGALQPIHDEKLIRMGLAEVYKPLCDRTQGEPCTLCVDRCPLGETAIRLNDYGPPEVLASGCVGCGVCQLYCPTTPKAIVVRPVRLSV